MFAGRYNAASVIMDESDKLFICGGKEGSTNMNTILVYDLNDNKHETTYNFSIGRRAHGIYLDEWNDRIFIGGGIDNTDYGQTFEYFDIIKNKCMNIVDTNNAHKIHPCVWMENNCLLYIMSVCNTGSRASSNSCEMIDLRIGDKWKVLVEDNVLKQVFGIEEKISTENVYLLSN